MGIDIGRGAMGGMGRNPWRETIAFAAVLLLLFQAAANVFACPDNGRSKFFFGANHAQLAADDDHAPNCGADATAGGAPGSITHPFLPNKEPAKRPHRDCPACQVFGCHYGVVLVEQSRVDVIAVADDVSWFVQDETRSDGEFATAHNRDPPFSFLI